MSKYLNTLGEANLAIFICPRCKFKRKIGDMVTDPNTQLKVCRFGCQDQKDPYRLPSRKPEKISIRYPRPEEPLVNPDPPYNP